MIYILLLKVAIIKINLLVDNQISIDLLAKAEGRLKKWLLGMYLWTARTVKLEIRGTIEAHQIEAYSIVRYTIHPYSVSHRIFCNLTPWRKFKERKAYSKSMNIKKRSIIMNSWINTNLTTSTCSFTSLNIWVVDIGKMGVEKVLSLCDINFVNLLS